MAKKKVTKKVVRKAAVKKLIKKEVVRKIAAKSVPMKRPVTKLLVKHQTLKSTRDGFGEALIELGKVNKNIVVLCADLTESVRATEFAKQYPERFFQCGVAEANMVGMAAGLALEGKIPFVTSFGSFVPNRCLDHIRQSVCYNQANVKFVSTHCGLITGEDGATHQPLEDIAIMRALPGMTVLVPADFNEAKKATLAAARVHGPVYIRLTRPGTEMITSERSEFKLGKLSVLGEGKDLTIIGCGPILEQVMLAAKELEKKKIKVKVVNCHTLKPIDAEGLAAAARETGAVLTVEDHQVYGGLGGAVAEVLGQRISVPLEILGVKNSFGESGKPLELLRKHGLDAISIAAAAEKLLKRKQGLLP